MLLMCIWEVCVQISFEFLTVLMSLVVSSVSPSNTQDSTLKQALANSQNIIVIHMSYVSGTASVV
jgi:hypothetical protein